MESKPEASSEDAKLESKVKKSTERVCENIHIVANDPSLAFYRLQEHVRKALPSMVDKRLDIYRVHKNLQGHCYDIEYAVSAVKAMDSASDSLKTTEELLKSAVYFKQHIRENKRHSYPIDAFLTKGQ